MKKGLSDWVEIFRGGKQVDSSGREHDGNVLIEKAVSLFNPVMHEPPAVIGHPKGDAPAYAWVEGLKSDVKDGVKVLFARFKQVVPEFEEGVKKGLWKKRSAAFYPDGSLRHVGFLGAAPPSVKGLADIKFEGDAGASFEFYDPGLSTIAKLFRNLRDWMIEKDGREAADQILSDWDLEYINEMANREPVQPAANGFAEKTKENDMNEFKEKVKKFLSFIGVDVTKVPDDAIPAGPPAADTGARTFTEADIEAARKEGETRGKTSAQTEFQETSCRETRKQEIARFIDQGVQAGEILPAWKDSGMAAFMEGLADSEIQFTEATKQSPYLWFTEFIKSIGKTDLFREIASKQRAGGQSDAKADEELGKSIARKAR
jgi:hypothetical protein